MRLGVCLKTSLTVTNHALVNSQLSETLPDVMPSIVCVASLFPMAVVPQVIPRIPICRLEFLNP